MKEWGGNKMGNSDLTREIKRGGGLLVRRGDVKKYRREEGKTTVKMSERSEGFIILST